MRTSGTSMSILSSPLWRRPKSRRTSSPVNGSSFTLARYEVFAVAQPSSATSGRMAATAFMSSPQYDVNAVTSSPATALASETGSRMVPS